MTAVFLRNRCPTRAVSHDKSAHEVWTGKKPFLANLKVFLCELGEMGHDEAVKIYEDNQGSIALAKNPESHKRTKHIDIRYHFVREKVEDGQVILEYIPTLDMLADIMTKAVPANQFCALRGKLGIKVLAVVESSGSEAKKTSRPAMGTGRIQVQIT